MSDIPDAARLTTTQIKLAIRQPHQNLRTRREYRLLADAAADKAVHVTHQEAQEAASGLVAFAENVNDDSESSIAALEKWDRWVGND